MKRSFLQLLLCVGLAFIATSGSRAWAQAPQRIEITARQFSFTPGEITLKKGQPVILELKSADVSHGLRIRDLHVDLKVKAGGDAEVQFTPDKVGDFTGHCSVLCGRGHGSMVFKVHVVA